MSNDKYKTDETVCMKVDDDDFRRVIEKFKYKSDAEDRYTSFDYCYNYFFKTEDLTKDIEKSCLVLGFYLASWGMYRGSSFLLQKSVKHFEPTIKYISGLPKSTWKIDVDNYDTENMEKIIDIYKEIKSLLVYNDNADLTLVTKVLLGVFGFVPAFDNYFCDTFRNITEGQCGFRALNKTSLSVIKNFYDANKSVIDDIAEQTFTKDFNNGKTEIKYPKAKIIDMYGFTYGLENSEKEKI